MNKKTLLILIVLAIFLIVGIIGAVLLWPKFENYMEYKNDMNGKDQPDKEYILTIEKADFGDAVAIRLEENGVVVSAIRFLNYIDENYPDFVWRNGIYHLNANMSYEQLCAALSHPDIAIEYVKFVVPEGMTVAAIASIVEESGLCSKEEFLEAADSYEYNYAFLDALKERDADLIGYKLEGFLFPATYEFRKDTVSAELIVDEMLNAFDSYVSQDMIDRAEEMGLSINEFVTLASVIQAEAFSTESMSGVSSVFWNRLNSNAYPRLQSDPTTKYAASLSDLDHYSSAMKRAYDTYQCTDIPVGPTNCPGLDALNSVLDPDDSEYYYFVTDKNGKFYFNETLAGHNRTISNLKAQKLWA